MDLSGSKMSLDDIRGRMASIGATLFGSLRKCLKL